MATLPLRRAAAPAQQYVPFLRLSDYSSGGMIPDGDYLIPDFSVVNFTPTKRDGTVAGPMRLSVRVTFDPPNGAQTQEDRREQHYSMGTNAHLLFQPVPTYGKRLIPVENATAGGFYDMSNWHLFLKSLYDSGMPEDFAVDDLTTLDGIVVHIKNVKEPEERKGFRTQNTGEVQADQKDRKIPIVTDILLAPWLAAGATRPSFPVPTQPSPAVRAALPLRGTVTAATIPVPPVSNNGAVDNETAVATAILSLFEKNPNGCSKLALQTGTFRALVGNPNQQQIMTTYFSDEATLSSLLNQMGYKLAAGKVELL